MTEFYCVITNREYLRIPGSGGRKRTVPIWRFFDPPPKHFLTSLYYLRGKPNFPHRRSSHFFDCGAWSYKDEQLPRWSPEECIKSYALVAGPNDFCAAPDHMVLLKHPPSIARKRMEITLDYATRFLELSQSYDFSPIAVVHGNTIKDRIEMTRRLVKEGYENIALGGLAARRDAIFLRELLTGTRQQTLDELDPDCRGGIIRLKRETGFYLHIFGVSSLSWYRVFRKLGVDSYDGSTMFFQAFKGPQYYWVSAETPALIEKFVIKGRPKGSFPVCRCLVCRTLRTKGIDTREMGSNENNMGRAVHNVNMYMRAKRMIDKEDRGPIPIHRP